MEIKEPEKLLIKIAEALDKIGISYCVTGGLAVSVWGRPRATFDIDIIVELFEPDIKTLHRALRTISRAGYFDEDAAKDALNRRGEFNFIEPESGLKIDFWVKKQDEYGRSQWARRRAEIIHGKKVFFVSAEDIILSKLQWYQKGGSTRQLEDIESILKISGDKLDLPYLKKWAAKLDVWKTLERLNQDVCPCGSGKKYKKCHGV